MPTNERTHKPNPTEIVRLCKIKGVSLDQLSGDSGITVKNLKRILKGGKAYLRTLAAIAKVLGTTANLLIAGNELACPSQDKKTSFTINISLEGNLNDAGQMANLVKLTPAVIENLKAAGVTITAFDSNLIVTEKIQAELQRIVILIYGMLETGNSFWLFAAVKPSKYEAMLAAQKAGTLDLYSFGPFGEIIVSGEGKHPPDEITQLVAEMYQTSPDVRLQPINGQKESAQNSGVMDVGGN